MRHELVLIAVALIILIAEVFSSPQNKGRIRGLAIILFAVNTIIGFFPATTGTLFGGMFTTIPLHAVVKNILNIGTLIVIIQSNTWLKTEENEDKYPEFYVLLISTLVGMFFMISAGDFLMFYLGLELATIPLAALVAYDRYRKQSAEGGIKLILSSAFSSGIMLYGISMFYGMYGSIYFDLLGPAMALNSLTILAFIFFFAGMAFKISLVPFHLWAADVYEGAPVNVTSYLSVISKGAAVFILTIILFKVFPSISDLWQKVVWVIAVMTMTIIRHPSTEPKTIPCFFEYFAGRFFATGYYRWKRDGDDRNCLLYANLHLLKLRCIRSYSSSVKCDWQGEYKRL